MSDILRVKVNGTWVEIPAIKGDPGEVRNADIAADFSAANDYATGDYVFYSGALYRFTQDHPAGAWNAAHVVMVKLGDEVSALSRDIGRYGAYVSAIEYGTSVPNSPSVFIPYLNVSDANAIIASNRNLYYGISYSNNNYAGFDMVTTAASTRVRTNSFYIPMGCKRFTLSGLPTDVHLIGIRIYDAKKVRLTYGYFGKYTDNGDGSYLIEVADGVAYMHLLFSKGSNQTFDYSVFDNNTVMLEVGDTAHSYITPARTTHGVAARAGELLYLSTYAQTTEYTILFSSRANITLWTNAVNDGNKVSGPYRFLSEVLRFYAYSYYHATDEFDYSTFNIDTSVSDFNTAVTALATANSSYMSVSTLGKDASNTYNILGCVLRSNCNSMLVKPSFYLIANQHGYEKGGAITAFWFMKLLCENPDDSDLITYLRNNVDFYIIPLMNPYGFEQYDTATAGTETGLYNYHGVNLNRNWSVGFQPSAVSGPSAFSENETALAKAFYELKGRMDACIDVHCNGGTRTTSDIQEYNWVSMALHPTGGVMPDAGRQHLANEAPHMCKTAGIADQIWGKITMSDATGGTAGQFFNHYNTPSCTFELMCRLPGESTEFSADCCKANLEMLVNFICMVLEKLKSLGGET